MWWSSKKKPSPGARPRQGRWAARPLAVLSLLALAACGFHPLYAKREAPGADPVAQMAGIQVAMIENRLGQKLRNELVARLNPRGEPAAAKYVLNVHMTETVSGLAHSQDGNATLAEYTVATTFSLTANGTRAGTSGSVRAMIASDFLGARYASVAAERDAEDRAITQTADQIVSQIAVYLNDPASRPRPQMEIPSPGNQRYQLLQGLPAPGQPEPQ